MKGSINEAIYFVVKSLMIGIERSWLNWSDYKEGFWMTQKDCRVGLIISMLLGGRIVYTGKDIAAAHAHAREQGLNDGHFDRFMNHFREALQEVGVEADKVEEVVKLLEAKRSTVLNP
jgi:hypothetical protein